MGWFCCVPGCSKRSESDKDVSFHCLPHHDKKLLKLWIHKIERKDLCISKSTRVCSRHFDLSKGRPRKRLFSLPTVESDDCSGETEAVNESISSVSTLTDVHGEDIEPLV